MSEKDGGAAFPREDYQDDVDRGQRGMSLRDYFAGQALAGMLAYRYAATVWDAEDVVKLAANAYFAADAMLKERSK